MQRAKETRWLKKYTKLEHLPSIIKEKQLHLGNPKDWEDKNDGELVRLYSEASGTFEMRATCLTGAADRYHFWEIFGKREQGVCIWFDRAELLRDIREDQSLVAKNAKYIQPARLSKTERALIPFAKREQYADEREFRVLRVKPAANTEADKFRFSASSLKRIYLNPWLSAPLVEQEKAKLSHLLSSDYEHVEVRQNRALRKSDWINAAKDALAYEPRR